MIYKKPMPREDLQFKISKQVEELERMKNRHIEELTHFKIDTREKQRRSTNRKKKKLSTNKFKMQNVTQKETCREITTI